MAPNTESKGMQLYDVEKFVHNLLTAATVSDLEWHLPPNSIWCWISRKWHKIGS